MTVGFDEWEPEQIAELIAGTLGVPGVRHGNTLTVPGLELKIEVGPVLRHDEGFVEVPIGVGDPAWGGYAWDRTIGVSDNGSHPVGEAVIAWTHYVLPAFVAMRMPEHPLATLVHKYATPGAEILAAPVMTRNFDGLPDGFAAMVGANPPTVAVAGLLAAEGELPERPMWLYTTCSRVAGVSAHEVTFNNVQVTEHFPGFADDLDWGDGSGTVKSWAVLRRVAE
jgi:hypothetical protein